MENTESNVEIDSVVDLELEVCEDPTDPITELRAGTLDKEVDPIFAGAAEVMAVGPETDADTCQADAPMGGHAIECFESSRGPTVVQPSQASGAMAYHDGMEQPASYPIGYMYFGPQAMVSGAMLVDSSSERGRELGLFEGLCSPHQRVERSSLSTWASITPTTTSAHATTTTTLTSTVVTCTVVEG